MTEIALPVIFTDALIVLIPLSSLPRILLQSISSRPLRPISAPFLSPPVKEHTL